MNIGFFSDAYMPQLNGVATNIEAVAAALECQGHCVSIFTPGMGDYVDGRPRVYRLPSIRAVKDPPLWLAAPLASKLSKEPAHMALDIVHLHTPFTMQFLGLQVARQARIPIVDTYHTLLPAHVDHSRVGGRRLVSPRLAERYSAWTCNLCDHIIAPSEKIKSALESYGVRRPISVVRNGVALGHFQHGERGYLRTRFGLPPGARIMLAVGRLTPEKNFGFLIRVLARVVAQDKNVYLALVGQGPLRSEFEKTAEQSGVRAHLILTGPIEPSEMPNVYADADLYVTSSLSEVQSVAALEALSASLPFVVVHDQAFANIVEDNKNGFAVAPDLDAFAARVLEIVAQPMLQQRMSLASREMSNEFSVEAQAQKLVSLYAEVITEKTCRHAAQRSPLRTSHA